VDTGQLFMKGSEQTVSPEAIKAVLTNEIARQLSSAIDSPPLLTGLLLISLAISAGLAVGYILGNYAPL